MMKVTGTSFASDYSPKMVFSSVCVNFNSSPILGLYGRNSRPIIFVLVME